jgi:RHS repeat-associated protein
MVYLSPPDQFTGRENDATGVHFYRARYYSPTFQRFISQEPFGFAGGDPNLYGFVINTPTTIAVRTPASEHRRRPSSHSLER